MAGVRVSQTKGTLAGTLYPGVHFVAPLVERVELFNTRDQLFTTGVTRRWQEGAGSKAKPPADVQAKEGLTLGLAITVRYQIDPQAPRLHRSQPAAAAGERNCAARGRHRVARTGAQLHRA